MILNFKAWDFYGLYYEAGQKINLYNFIVMEYMYVKTPVLHSACPRLARTTYIFETVCPKGIFPILKMLKFRVRILKYEVFEFEKFKFSEKI